MKKKRFIAVLALLIVAVYAQAQSGRRQVKPPPVAPVPSPTPEPTPIAKKEDKKSELVILVGVERYASPSSIPLQYHSVAQQGCADRIRARSEAEVDAPMRDMGRGEAIEKAKASKNTYVVLLKLNYDAMARSYDDLVLEFVVFAPTTAKVVTTGRSYVNANRAGPIVVGPTTRLPTGVFREQWLRNAGEEVADRVLKKLNLVVK